MAPDGSTFSQADIENAQPKVIPAINPHLKASLPLTRENMAELRLLLQQFIKQGKSVGILTGAYAARLNDLTDEELAVEVEKNRKAIEDALIIEWKEQIADKIEFTRNEINEKLDEINDEIKKETRRASKADETAHGGGARGRRARNTSGQSSDKRISALRRQKDQLQNLDDKLDNANTTLKNTNTPHDLTKLETQVNNIADKVEKAPSPRTLNIDLSFAGSQGNDQKDDPSAQIA